MHNEFPTSEFTKKVSVKSNRILFNVLGRPLHRGCGDLNSSTQESTIKVLKGLLSIRVEGLYNKTSSYLGDVGCNQDLLAFWIPILQYANHHSI